MRASRDPTTDARGRNSGCSGIVREARESRSFDSIRKFLAPADLGDILSTYEDIGCESGKVQLTYSQIAWPCGMWWLYCVLLCIFSRLTTSRWVPPATRNSTSLKLEFSNVQFVHAAVTVSFAVTLVMGMFDFFWAREKVKKHTSLWVCYVNALSLTTYGFLCWNGMPFMQTPQGEVDSLRILFWMFSTPGMINITACLVSHRKRLQVSENHVSKVHALAVFSDMVMIFFGMLERCLVTPFHQLSFFASMVAFGWTLRHFKVLFELSAVELVHRQDRLNLKRVHNFTVCIWSIFPLLRVCQLAGILSNDMEEIGNTVMDLAAKLVYTVCLMVVNFTVIDQVLVDRLSLAKEYLEDEVNKSVERDMRVIDSVSDQYERKMLAYKEAEVWRHHRAEVMQNEGYPSQRVSALLDSTLSEYVALSSGNISAYFTHDDHQVHQHAE